MSEKVTFTKGGIYYRQYNGESDLQYIMSLVQNELSEPYVIYTYRYFLQGWPNLSFLAFPEAAKNEPQDTSIPPIGVIVCKQSIHKGQARRGYIAMLSVDREWRKRGIASTLVQLSMDMMIRTGADEIVLETEVDNVAALGLYASLGFIREKRLYRFYMNGKDAFRLVLPVLPSNNNPSTSEEDITSASITVPQPIHIGAKTNNNNSRRRQGVATLDTPPSPLLPIHGGGRNISPDLVDPMESNNSSANNSFAIGGILGAAAPRSVDSNDSFLLYGSHIPSSISPPLPPRTASGTSVGAGARRNQDDEHYYTSSR